MEMLCQIKIQPRHHDNQLSYAGGETKILAVERSIRFPAFAAILPAAAADDVCFKYQLPGEDLDALISITNDKDLDHMMLEYDRLLRPAARPAPRLRLFPFPLALSPSAPEQRSDDQWFVDALNSAPAQPEPTPAVAAAGPDFLFGLDSGFVPPPAIKVKDPSPLPPTVAPPAPAPEPVAVEPIPSEAPVKDERQTGAEAVADIQRQIKDPGTRFTKILIRHGMIIDSIRFQYDCNGKFRWSQQWGGDGGANESELHQVMDLDPPLHPAMNREEEAVTVADLNDPLRPVSIDGGCRGFGGDGRGRGFGGDGRGRGFGGVGRGRVAGRGRGFGGDGGGHGSGGDGRGRGFGAPVKTVDSVALAAEMDDPATDANLKILEAPAEDLSSKKTNLPQRHPRSSRRMRI